VKFQALRGALYTALAASPLHAATTTILTLAAGGLGPLSAWALSRLLADVASGEVRAANAWVIVLVVATAMNTAMVPLLDFSQSELTRRMTRRVQDRFFKAINRIPGLAPFETPYFRDELRLAQQASETAPMTVANSLISLGQSSISLISFGVFLFLHEPGPTLVLLALVIPAAWVNLRDSNQQIELMWRTTPSERRRIFYSSLLFDIQALKETRVYGLSAFFQARMNKELRKIHRQERGQQLRIAWLHVGVACASAFGYGFLILHAFLSSSADVGTLTLVVASASGFQQAFLRATERAGAGWRAVSLYETYSQLVSRLEQGGGDLDPPEPGPFEELRFENVTFRYEGGTEDALYQVNFSIRRGEMVGLVGVNGAGKSTLTKLICRLYAPTSGRILWNEYDIAAFDIASYRQQLGFVFQDFMSYDFTLAENIGLGDLDRSFEPASIQAAARKVGVDEIAADLPSGYDTSLSREFEPEEIGASSVTLSGGQWQRVAIARALMRDDRPLLVLDEPTSGMDPAREARTRNALFSVRGKQSMLCISHRLSNLRPCDRILVLERGRIVEQGSHVELMHLPGGHYKDLFTVQAAGYGIDS